MRGADEPSGPLVSYVDIETPIPPRHPLREIRRVVNDALATLNAEFEAPKVPEGRPSISPERLIRASLLRFLFAVRSERWLIEQMDYNQLFRACVGLGIFDGVWVPTVLTQIRGRLPATHMARKGIVPTAESARWNSQPALTPPPRTPNHDPESAAQT